MSNVGPSPFVKKVFDAPAWLYRHGLGWVLGRRFLAVTHRGRKSGRLYDTVLEVAVYDAATDESIVAAAYGPTADWYRNLRESPAIAIRQGQREYVPVQRFLEPDEARRRAEEFCTNHRLEARVAPRVMDAIGAVPLGTFDDPVDLMASMPMVGFRPAVD